MRFCIRKTAVRYRFYGIFGSQNHFGRIGYHFVVRQLDVALYFFINTFLKLSLFQIALSWFFQAVYRFKLCQNLLLGDLLYNL